MHFINIQYMLQIFNHKDKNKIQYLNFTKKSTLLTVFPKLLPDEITNFLFWTITVSGKRY